jgi:hypothetical protein
MMAMPGMFCDAMATKYRGIAIVKIEPRLNNGWMRETFTNQSDAETTKP